MPNFSVDCIEEMHVSGGHSVSVQILARTSEMFMEHDKNKLRNMAVL